MGTKRLLKVCANDTSGKHLLSRLDEQAAGKTSATDLYALSADNAYRSVADVSPVTRSRKRYDRRPQYCAPTAANGNHYFLASVSSGN